MWSPNLSNVADEDKWWWMQLIDWDLNFLIQPDADAFSKWQNLPSIEFGLEQMNLPSPSNPQIGTIKRHSFSKVIEMNGATLNLTCELPSPPNRQT
jgi:hypothetical protein